jgi:uncharacterized membrane protein YccC
MTFPLVFSATVLGSILGNLVVFLILGIMAKRAEKKQAEELHRLQAQFLEMTQREAERMKRYAQMEG